MTGNLCISLQVPSLQFIFMLLNTYMVVHSASQYFYNELSSWTIQVWIKIHLISESNCNIVNLLGSKSLRKTNNVIKAYIWY